MGPERRQTMRQSSPPRLTWWGLGAMTMRQSSPPRLTWWGLGAIGLLVGCAPPMEPTHAGSTSPVEGPSSEAVPRPVLSFNGNEPAPRAAQTARDPTGDEPTGTTKRERSANDPSRPLPPAGYVEMTVVGVAPTDDGEAVLLVDAARSVIVPIFVGNTEALSIQLRHRQEHFARPLTHDLLDAVLRELGARVVKVHVDDIKGRTFVGAVFVRSGERTIELDARPSDAIALALGSGAPIFVAEQVVRGGGIRKDSTPSGPVPNDVPHI